MSGDLEYYNSKKLLLMKNDFQKSICYGKYNPHPAINYKSEGSFSRYFDLDKWHINKLPKSAQKTFPFMIVPKASSSEKNDGMNGDENKQVCRTNNAGEFKNLDIPVGNSHPTVKPIKLMSYLITLGSRENDLILDPFIGSGTTAIASRKLTRNFIGFELSKEYHKIAEARIKDELAQKKLGEVALNDKTNKEVKNG